jgi:hypothetical protein
VGSPGVTPFGTSTVEAQQASRVLSTALADKSERRMVLDEFGYANALGLDVFQKVNMSGSSETLREGMISRALAFDWYEDQQVPTPYPGSSRHGCDRRICHSWGFNRSARQRGWGRLGYCTRSR